MPPDNLYSEFTYHWISAVAGETPEGIIINADSNGDGFISMSEAFHYAENHDTRPETPQYKSTPLSLGAYLALQGKIPYITGPDVVLDQGTYTITNFPDGALVNWEPSNENLTLVSGQGTDTAVFQSDFYGECTINAIITGAGCQDITVSRTVFADIDLDDVQFAYIDGTGFACGPTATFTMLNLTQPSTISWDHQPYTSDSVYTVFTSSYSGSPGIAKITAEIMYRGKPQEIEHEFNFSFDAPGTPLSHDFTLYPQVIVEKSCKTIQMNTLQLWYYHLNWCCSTIPI
jgi:hypothetical protein